MFNIEDSYSKHKKSSSETPRTPTPSRGNRSSPAKKGAAPALQEKSPVLISTEQQGDKASSDPRTWRAPETVQPPTEDTGHLDDRITRLVATSLAKALPAALGAPALTQGRTSLDALAFTQGRTSLHAPAHTQGRTQRDSQDSVTEQAPAVGVPAPSGLAAAVGRPPRPPTGPVNADRSRRGETERRMVVLGQSLHEYEPSSASVPLVGHSAPPPTQNRRPAATVSKLPRMSLPLRPPD